MPPRKGVFIFDSYLQTKERYYSNSQEYVLQCCFHSDSFKFVSIYKQLPCCKQLPFLDEKVIDTFNLDQGYPKFLAGGPY